MKKIMGFSLGKISFHPKAPTLKKVQFIRDSHSWESGEFQDLGVTNELCMLNMMQNANNVFYTKITPIDLPKPHSLSGKLELLKDNTLKPRWVRWRAAVTFNITKRFDCFSDMRRSRYGPGAVAFCK